MEMTASAMRKRRFVMDYSERRDDSSGARVAAFIATMDDSETRDEDTEQE